MTHLLLRKMDERARLAERLAKLDGEIAKGCRLYSDARGFRVVLRPQQVRHDIEAEERRRRDAEGVAA